MTCGTASDSEDNPTCSSGMKYRSSVSAPYVEYEGKGEVRLRESFRPRNAQSRDHTNNTSDISADRFTFPHQHTAMASEDAPPIAALFQVIFDQKVG